MYSLSALRTHGVGGVVRQHGYRPSWIFRFLHRLHICFSHAQRSPDGYAVLCSLCFGVL